MEKLNSFKLFCNRVYYNLFIENFNKTIDFKFEKNIFRWDLLQTIIEKKNYKNYLEIGCDDDLLFSKINIYNKVGVDPVSGGNVRKTSDDFFKNNEIKFDLIFIDGLHYYEQVKKDIENSLIALKPDGLILLHDCLPSRQSHQAVPRYRGRWTGDVWKAIVEFRTKENLNIFTILMDMGISVIQKKKNDKLLKIKNQNFKNLKFKDFFYNHKEYMNIVSYQEALNLI